MQAFLQEVAKKVINSGINIQSSVFVFPNKRASLYFRKYLAGISGKASWSPRTFDIENLIGKFTGFKAADPVYLLFELYRTYKNIEITGKTKESSTFDKFYGLGEIILSDFNDVDAYLADVEKLFCVVRDIREIDLVFDYLTDNQKEILRQYWRSFSAENLSNQKQRFLELWNCMTQLYFNFTHKLIAQKTGYNGLIYRYLSDNLEQIFEHQQNRKKYHFIGFNALNAAQEKLFSYLQKNGMAEFHWDVDNYYIENEHQEAGLFLRKNIQKFEPKAFRNSLEKNIGKNPARIELIAIPQSIGQAKILPKILAEHPEFKEDETAIVLADEKMLFPVLHALPESIEHLNVTMGYPLNDSPLYPFIVKYLQLQQQLAAESGRGYYYNHVLALLRHPLLYPFAPEFIQDLITKIEGQNRVYIPANWFENLPNRILNHLFSQAFDTFTLITNLMEILYELYVFNNERNPENSLLLREFIYHVYLKMKRLREMLSEGAGISSEIITLETTSRLIIKNLKNESIPFSGEAAEGLQILGLMETRNLDFKNLIILGMNEGLFPSVATSPSFISQNLREIYGLPVQKQQDAIFAYIFYRLLQRTDNMVIVYNNITSETDTGEVSRFVQQIRLETDIIIEERILTEEISPSAAKPITINKNADTLKPLFDYIVQNGRSRKKLSASAINTYLDCKLRFYFRYIALISENQEISEEIMPDVLGTLVHYILEQVYKRITDEKAEKSVSSDEISFYENNLDDLLYEAFHQHFRYGDTEKYIFEGNSLIAREIVKKYVLAILAYDKKIAPFTIISLEERNQFSTQIPFSDGENELEARFGGAIDRIDQLKGEYRILDYKTGQAEKEYRSMESLFDRRNLKRPKAVMQTMLYSQMFAEKYPHLAGQLSPVIYNIDQMFNEDFEPGILFKDDKQETTALKGAFLEKQKPEFVELIGSVLSEIFDPEISFDQAEDTGHCTYCPYNQICNRQSS
jgi:hypothetical protein